MTDEHTAAFLAGQSAIIAKLIEVLVSNGTVRRQDVERSLMDLLDSAKRERPASAAPIHHVIDLMRAQPKAADH